MGNKKVYETASDTESRDGNQSLRISEEMGAICRTAGRLQLQTLLIENKWFAEFERVSLLVGMWNAQGSASRWVCSLKYALISWLLVEVEKSALDCSLKALGFSC